ncbi:MAG: hypothetical protein ACFE9T_09665 [Promethearchaeota archaeon]
MVVKANDEINIDVAFEYYNKIKIALTGIKEILNINFNKENFYYQAGMDNLQALNDIIIELLKYTYSPREVRIKLREVEFDELETETK